MTHDPTTERARSDAWHAQHDALAAEVAALSPLRARQLAFALVTEMIAQLVAPGAPLAAILVQRLADVVELVAALRLVIAGTPPACAACHGAAEVEAWPRGPMMPCRTCAATGVLQLSTLRGAADRQHGRLFGDVGPRGAWPDELRLPADAAEAVRRACEDDVHGALATLYTGARAALALARLDVGPLDDLWQEAAREATIAALDDLVNAAAREPKADVVLQALHVTGGAAAVNALRRLPAPPADDPRAVARGELCQPGRHRLGCPHEIGDAPHHTTPEERAWCRDLAARATSGAFATKEPAT